MDNNTKTEKIKQFINDPLLPVIVKDEITKSFLKNSESDDVHHLAAARIAINLLNDAWRDLEKYRRKEETEHRSNKQVGL